MAFSKLSTYQLQGKDIENQSLPPLQMPSSTGYVFTDFAEEYPSFASLLRWKDSPVYEHPGAPPNAFCRYCKFRTAKRERGDSGKLLGYCPQCEREAMRLGIKMEDLLGHAEKLYEEFEKNWVIE